MDNVWFHVHKGETFGPRGELGCGKSTIGRTIIRLYDATAGKVLFKGRDVHGQNRQQMQQFRREVQMIFQDPYVSLNPRMTVEDIVAEGLDIHRLVGSKSERRKRVQELLEIVGLNPEHLSRYPHEFSGGQRQRIGIARALAVEPEFIIADEPISALDVSIQAQVINLMRRLQREKGLTYLFIAHDLSMVKHISDRVGVMYLGHLVEVAESEVLTQTRSTLTPERYCQRSQFQTRTWRKSGSASYWKAMCRVRSPLPAVAVFAPAVPTP